jgi:hypothetical protein
MIPVTAIAIGPTALTALVFALLGAVGFKAARRGEPMTSDEHYEALVHRLRHPWVHRLQAPLRWFRD